MSITKEAIIKASLDILNRGRIESLSMRTLAKELNIKAASLYWHIKSKQDLYDLIAEHITQKISLPKTIDDPKEALTILALEFRRVLLETRDAVDIFAQSIPRTPNRIKIIKFVLDALTKYGVSDKNCITAGNLINNYILSFVADEIRAKHISPEEAKNFELFWGEQYEMNLDFEQQFLYGLRVLFAGLLVK
ncbi:TetR/AcrR family transcriptional regulator C-terminal domain-containing protein [Schnuerera sp. xch1]|uniref:TetR/AcrR family transcriptional regulator C-terminal domain-containing protein n=1 Tax=Schnuerera sp. xch1 TaxID=2874283 RepID=UPI001CBD843E|nr:TetR/AcrR family transcriptional regulator C-terminal domain-containing protein [Schnuerera sp. xch1]MBZ2174303.1 TetR/AcrR family transcriptional regulator C-terminal domain-containing protein [Schnuerera sp. xch1]